MDNTTVITIVLTVVALGTSIISAIIGMGGGILLLAVMYTVLPEKELVVPMHASVQLISNFSRVLAYIKNVHWKMLSFFLVGAVPGLVLGTVLLLRLLEHREEVTPYMMLLVGCFILIVTYRKKNKTKNDFPLERFVWLGSYAAPLSLLFGATGPVLAPYFMRDDLKKAGVVATKAICQFCVHFLKMIIFYYLFTIGANDKILKYEDLLQPGTMLAFLLVAAIVGTFVGKGLNEKVSEERFKKMYVVVLNVAGFKILLVDGVWQIILRFL